MAALFATTGTSHAGLDNELSLVDGKDRTLTVQQWDTFLNGVFPLDRNRLTREWFHSGKARYNVAGPGADEFEGTLELGYQIGFPWSLGVGINFSYTTPNILIDDGNFENGFAQIITPNLFPGVSISADLGNGPGIQEVATFSVDVSGAQGAVAVSNAHGTVTGAAGGVLLRPFARLIASTGDSVTTSGAQGAVAVSNAHGTVTGAAGGVLLRPFARLIASTGDSVTTYGEPWNMN
uniref:MspA family porin n=1 Tax=Mycolicibacterium sediminis TaxID=1286180 RepID=UPI003908ADCC